MMLIQFALSCAYGFVAFVALQGDPNPKVPMFGALIVGFFGMRATMFVYVWARWGWSAARSMRMDFR